MNLSYANPRLYLSNGCPEPYFEKGRIFEVSTFHSLSLGVD